MYTKKQDEDTFTFIQQYKRLRKEKNSPSSVRNNLDWKTIHQRIFPLGVPEQCTWTNLTSIKEVLNLIGSSEGSNHAFFPNFGGDKLKGCKISAEESCLEIIINGGNIIKPKKLIFEGFDGDLQWNYFRVELNNLEPFDIFSKPNKDRKSANKYYECVFEIRPGEYCDSLDWENRENNLLLDYSNQMNRWFKGSFVIFQTGSTYNYVSATYDARHNRMDSMGFRKYINKNKSICESY